MSKLDDFIYYCRQLEGPAYRPVGGRDGSTYEQCLPSGGWPGVDCSGMFDVVLRHMELKDGTPWGTGAIYEVIRRTGNYQTYDPEKFYPRGAVVVNDNAGDWDTRAVDYSHVALITDVEDQNPGQMIVHSGDPGGVSDSDTDYITNQRANYEIVGPLPQLGWDLPGWIEIDGDGWLRVQDGAGGFFGIDGKGWVQFLGYYKTKGWIRIDENGYLQAQDVPDDWFGIDKDGYLKLSGSDYSNGYVEAGENGYLKQHKGPGGWIDVDQDTWLRYKP